MVDGKAETGAQGDRGLHQAVGQSGVPCGHELPESLTSRHLLGLPGKIFATGPQ